MNDQTRIRIGFFALSGLLILVANTIGHEVGQFNWSGLLSYGAGFAGAWGVFYRFRRQVT